MVMNVSWCVAQVIVEEIILNPGPLILIARHSMLLNGWIFKTGAIGGVIFLLALIPFGLGSRFPSTLIMAIAMIVISKKHADNFLRIPVNTPIA